MPRHKPHDLRARSKVQKGLGATPHALEKPKPEGVGVYSKPERSFIEGKKESSKPILLRVLKKIQPEEVASDSHSTKQSKKSSDSA
jgi:hypothetical protein